MKITLLFTVCLLLAGFVHGQAAVGNDIELKNMARELVNLRTEVETLSNKLTLKKQEVQSSLENLASQKKDLDRQRANIERRMAEIKQKVKKNEEEIKSKEQTRRQLKPIVLNLIGALRGYIHQFLPFKVPQRLNELDKLADTLRKDKQTPDRILSQLWSVVEDELRMTRESGLYKQNIMLHGENTLADVARLGMVFLYFKTLDGNQVGYAVKQGDEWIFTAVVNRDDAKRIRYLFDCLLKHIREGYYELPNPGREGDTK